MISVKYSSLGGCFRKFKKNTHVKCNQHRKPQLLNVFALNHFMSGNSELQKQPPRGVPRKKCSENIQQIYRKTPMLKCNFNKALELYWNHTSAWVFSCKFPAYFQCTFSSEHLQMAAFAAAIMFILDISFLALLLFACWNWIASKGLLAAEDIR